MVIRGPAGSGKTTWMKWTFRRLLERPGALPFMVELRKLAADWEKVQPRGSDRTLEPYLESCIAEAGLRGWAGPVGKALESETGPRPVLLVDGWDELGPLGHEIREKLYQLLLRSECYRLREKKQDWRAIWRVSWSVIWRGVWRWIGYETGRGIWRGIGRCTCRRIRCRTGQCVWRGIELDT